jgi:GntR family transcriptional repressor for pyruvate dehydrogenase complex
MNLIGGVVLKTERARLTTQTIGRLEAMILRQKYKVNQRLPPERELSATLGISRPVLREAISVLEHQGILSVRQGSGTYVKRLPRIPNGPLASREEFLDLLSQYSVFEFFEFRKALEAETSFLAAQRATPSNLEALVKIHKRLNDRDPTDPLVVEDDFLFHRGIAEASHNQVFLRAIEALSGLYYDTLTRVKAHTVPESRQVVLNDHSAILQALISRDSKAAREAMIVHLSHLERRMLEHAGLSYQAREGTLGRERAASR